MISFLEPAQRAISSSLRIENSDWGLNLENMADQRAGGCSLSIVIEHTLNDVAY